MYKTRRLRRNSLVMTPLVLTSSSFFTTMVAVAREVSAVPKSTFVRLGKLMLQRQTRDRLDDGDFRSLFGVSAIVCCIIWKKYHFPPSTKPKHLLWVLMFMKTYAVETVLCSISRVTRKTFRNWSWCLVGLIAHRLWYITPVN